MRNYNTKIVVLIFVLFCCKRKEEVKQVFPNQIYEGKGVLLFRMPVSGSTYQMTFLPTDKFIEDIEQDIPESNIGTALWIVNREYLEAIFKYRKRVEPLNFKSELNPSQRYLYYVNVDVTLNVQELRSGFPKLFQDTLDFKKTVTYKYILPSNVEIKKLEVKR